MKNTIYNLEKIKKNLEFCAEFILESINCFSDEYKANIFGKAVVTKHDFERNVCFLCEKLSKAQLMLSNSLSELFACEKEILLSLEKAYADVISEKAIELEGLLKKAEKYKDFCVCVSLYCIEEYEKEITEPLKHTFDGKKTAEIDVSLLLKSAKSFSLRIEQYLKNLNGE